MHHMVIDLPLFVQEADKLALGQCVEDVMMVRWNCPGVDDGFYLVGVINISNMSMKTTIKSDVIKY